MPAIIGSVVFTPASPRAGESVKIEVKPTNQQAPAPAGGGLIVAGALTPKITINGVPGSVRYITWERAGKKHIFIAATTTGKTVERRHEVVTVRPSLIAFPKLRAELLLEFPTKLRFSVQMPTQWLGRTTGTLQPFQGTRQAKPGRVKGQGLVKSLPGVQPSPPVFEWDFGKGFLVGTKVPYITHDFGLDQNVSVERASFHVAARVVVPGKPVIEIRQTILIVNPYGIARKRGVLQPLVEQELNAHFANAAYHGKMTIRNPESFEIKMDSRRVEIFFADGRRLSVLQPKQPASVKLAPQSETVFTTSVSASQIPKDAVAFAVHYAGKAKNLPTRMSAYFDIPSRWWRQRQLLPTTVQRTLRSIAVRKMTPSPTRITFREIEDLVSRGEISLASLEPGGFRAGALGRLAGLARSSPVMQPMSSHIEPPFPTEGGECTPDNLPSDVPEGFVCQATSETRYVAMPGRFMNAKKGDAILSPGGTGLIGGLLRQVEPAQNYSHSGIMTRNHDEITHSTASEERLLDYPVGSFMGTPAPTDGHRPDVLKYLWPGVITQTVEESVHGEWFTDPDTNPKTNKQVSYEISGFYPNNKKLPDSTDLIPPLVVKPDPMVETPEHRKHLHEAADFAIDQPTKSHYRFYCYTDPAIGLDQKAPDSAKWAKGTYPSVCSSFVWMCLRQAGFSFEGGQIEATDKAKGADFGPDQEDGLYLYTAEERREAAEWLYDQLYDMVIEDAEIQGPEGLISAFTDMPDDVANQILNTFASDWSDTDAKDSDAWKSTIDTRSVSPDNILFWDTPAQGGPYGYFEPLVYRPPRYELVTVHRWKKITFTGTLKGIVRFGGKPVKGAQVQVYDGMFAPTGTDGHFVLKKVPVAHYKLEAYKIQDGLYLSESVDVEVKKDQDTDVTVDLKPPDDMYRAVTIDGSMYTVDDEWMAAANPHSWKVLHAVLRVGPSDTHDEITFSDVCDGDVRSEFHVEADWNLDKSVVITFTGRIYETADPSAGIDSETTKSFTVAPGGIGHWEGMKLFNDDDDSVEIEFDAKNDLQVT